MSPRIAAGVVASALALSLASSAGAHAADSYSRSVPLAQTAVDSSGYSALSGMPGVPAVLKAGFSKIKINKGKPVSVKPKASAAVPYTFTVTHDSTVNVHADDFLTGIEIYTGSADKPKNPVASWTDPECEDATTTAYVCTGTIKVSPATDLDNAAAGRTWHAAVWAWVLNGQDPSSKNFKIGKTAYADHVGATAPTVLRHATLTTDASPERVKKGKNLTVSGTLKRANWNVGNYSGYAKQKAQLQFRASGSSSYKTVKTVTTDKFGRLKTTVKAAKDGSWRYIFAGNATTSKATSSSDFVDVK
ncbi:hypothetical protein [Streptomyces sp. NBC_01237]|uniref:hypothetical protein n=1 Tax=Streptomyces sp. NBC_01237 TaxID=2903790 RepID=UPI002DD859E1|nr:hypothetical protein [Streptomyces sp. NBC_01237]WRZ70176.1 hypothetical protein OG251_00105 [Streptomyces sp. NBC_01237]